MTSRKDFLTAGTLVALTPSLARAAEPPAATGSADELTFAFDRAKFRQILEQPAKHKQCFGSTKIEKGTVLDGMQNSMNAYERYLNEGPHALQAVAVLYHGAAIAMAMTDGIWNGMLAPVVKDAPPEIRSDLGEVAARAGNPYKDRVAELVRRGASFFVCHNAIAGFAGLLAGALKRPAEQIHAELMNGLLPGALAVPAGVMAINACQEAKFTYIQSTL